MCFMKTHQPALRVVFTRLRNLCRARASAGVPVLHAASSSARMALGASSHPCREGGESGPIQSIVFMVLLTRVRRKLNKDPPLKLRIWG